MTDDQTTASLSVMPRVRKILGSNGVTFKNYFASYPLCCPSRTTYFTGQYAHNHHVEYNDGSTGGFHVFHGQNTTFPVALRRAGYTTIHIGKYLNGYGKDHPRHVPPGWSDWNGSVDPSTYRYYDFTLNENGKLHTFGRHQYQTDVYTKMAIDKIRKYSKRENPFFLDVAFLAPHSVERETSGLDPLDEQAVGHNGERFGIRYPVPARRDIGRFRHVKLPDGPAFNERDVSDKPFDIAVRPRFNAPEKRDIAHNYRVRLETLLEVDRDVPKIVDALKKSGRLDNTYIFFCSDNGYFHGEHRIPFGKFLPYEPSIRVPLIVRGPGVAKDATSTALVSNVDVPATILKVTGVRPLRVLDGRSLVPLLADPASAGPHRAILLESGPNDSNAPVYQGLRTKRYKYIEYNDGERELYDLQRDPFELHNRAGSPALRSVERRLARELAKARHCRGRACP